METIEIQVQTVNNNWMTTQVTQTNQDQHIRTLLEVTRNSYRSRVRAIDSNRRIIDILEW